MKRYDMNNACDGESGECRAEMVPTVYGDYVLFDDIPADMEADAALWREHGARLMEAADTLHRIIGEDMTHEAQDFRRDELTATHAIVRNAREASERSD